MVKFTHQVRAPNIWEKITIIAWPLSGMDIKIRTVIQKTAHTTYITQCSWSFTHTMETILILGYHHMNCIAHYLSILKIPQELKCVCYCNCPVGVFIWGYDIIFFLNYDFRLPPLYFLFVLYTRLIVPHVEQDLFTFPGFLLSPKLLRGVCIAQSLFLCCVLWFVICLCTVNNLSVFLLLS